MKRVLIKLLTSFYKTLGLTCQMLQAINNLNVIITVAGILYVQNKRVKYELKHYTTAVTDNQDESLGVTERGGRKGGFVVGKVRFR